MSRFVKGVALFIVVVSVVWVAVLWRWQATSRDMTTQDIVVYLGLLPITVFAVALLGGWAWRGFTTRESERAAAAAAAPKPAAPAAASDDAERYRTLQLLAAHVLTAAGASASELMSAARDGEPRPALDTELRDDDGLPLLAGRIAAVDGAALAQEFEAELAAVQAQQTEWAARTVPDHVWRALAALREPLERALEALLPWAHLWAASAAASGMPAAAAATAGVAAPATSGAERSVRVLLGWPLGWTDFEQELGRTLASTWIARLAAAVLPGARFAISAQAVGGEELLLQADRLMLTLARAKQDEPLIVAACHSAIGHEAVAALERNGQLFQPQRRPKGRIPAEAAAALVLAGSDWPPAPDADDPVPHLHRPALLRRDKSVDAPGRVGAQTATEAMRSALVATRSDAAKVTALATDTDQHTARAAECFVAAADVLPHVDATDDVCAFGHVTGSVEGVSALLVVACAAARARADESPCLALTVGDPVARLALVALPKAPVAAVDPVTPAAASA